MKVGVQTRTRQGQSRRVRHSISPLAGQAQSRQAKTRLALDLDYYEQCDNGRTDAAGGSAFPDRRCTNELKCYRFERCLPQLWQDRSRLGRRKPESLDNPVQSLLSSALIL